VADKGERMRLRPAVAEVRDKGKGCSAAIGKAKLCGSARLRWQKGGGAAGLRGVRREPKSEAGVRRQERRGGNKGQVRR
jgi:hypothetical protein